MSAGYIPIRSELPADSLSAGSVSAVLNEIGSRLEILCSSGESWRIDLRSLPFSAQERDRLKALLGQGEVVVHIAALGPSELAETGYAGVWWVTHRNAEGAVVAELIEVTRVPDLLESPEQDVRASLSRLQGAIARCATLSEELP